MLRLYVHWPSQPWQWVELSYQTYDSDTALRAKEPSVPFDLTFSAENIQILCEMMQWQQLTIYQSQRCHIPDNLNLHQHHHKNPNYRNS